MSNIITDIEQAFEGVDTWLTNILGGATNFVANIKADINYLTGTALTSFETWFSNQAQTLYTTVQGYITLAESALESAAGIVTTVYNLAKQTLAAIADFFETTGSSASTVGA